MVIDKIVESHSTVCKVTLSKQSTNILKNETLIPTNKRNPNTLTILEQVEETMKKKKQEMILLMQFLLQLAKNGRDWKIYNFLNLNYHQLKGLVVIIQTCVI